MKIHYTFFALAFCVYVIIFNSCGSIATPNATQLQPITPQPITDNMQVPLTDDEIVEIIDNLLLYEKYGIYASLQTSNETDKSGMYYKVIDENFDEYNEWVEFIENIFCDKYLEMVYNETSGSIVNIDGYTYDDGSASGWTLSNDYTYKIFENDAQQTILTIIRNDFSYGHERIDEKSVILRKTETGWKISDTYFQ